METQVMHGAVYFSVALGVATLGYLVASLIAPNDDGRRDIATGAAAILFFVGALMSLCLAYPPAPQGGVPHFTAAAVVLYGAALGLGAFFRFLRGPATSPKGFLVYWVETIFEVVGVVQRKLESSSGSEKNGMKG